MIARSLLFALVNRCTLGFQVSMHALLKNKFSITFHCCNDGGVVVKLFKRDLNNGTICDVSLSAVHIDCHAIEG